MDQRLSSRFNGGGFFFVALADFMSMFAAMLVMLQLDAAGWPELIFSVVAVAAAFTAALGSIRILKKCLAFLELCLLNVFVIVLFMIGSFE